MAVAVRGRAARRYRRAFRRSSSARSRNLEWPRPAGAPSWSSPAIASAPAISRPISPASWPGATGAFRTLTCSTASAWARCVAPTARSCWAKWASIPPMPAASIFRRERPISTISGGDAVDMSGSVAREVEEETGLAPADYRAGAHWDCVVSGAAIAMIRILDVDLAGEALRARIEANLARQHQPELVGDPSGARDVAISRRRCRVLSPRLSRSSSQRSVPIRTLVCECARAHVRDIFDSRTGAPVVMSKKPSPSLAAELKPFVAPFRFDGSGKFHLRSHKTNEKGGLDKDKAEKILEANRQAAERFSGTALRAGSLVAAGDPSGHGRGGQGQRHQEHLRGRQSAGLRGLFVQAADIARTRPRFHVAQHDCAAGARPHRHLQSFLLRGMPGDAGASGIPRQGEDPAAG